MKFLILVALLAASCSGHIIRKRAAQEPKVWDALKELRGGKDLTTEQIQELLSNAVAGSDYPTNAEIPEKEVDCKSYAQLGYYADDSEPSKCQVFHRCDDNGVATSYLCPNQTLFNQITLVCDWFVNVDCKVSKKFQDYSNSRLAEEGAKLLDDQEVIEATGAVEKSAPAADKKAPAKASAAKKEAPAAKGAKVAAAPKEAAPAKAAAKEAAPAKEASAAKEADQELDSAEEASAEKEAEKKEAPAKEAAAAKEATPAKEAAGAKTTKAAKTTAAAKTTVAAKTTAASEEEDEEEPSTPEEK